MKIIGGKLDKLNILFFLGVFALLGGVFFHSSFELSHAGDFFSGGAVMWGFFAIGRWARKKDESASKK